LLAYCTKSRSQESREAASAGNDHRLGSNEAPPAIISMFLGEELTEILESIKNGSDYESKEREQMEIGVSVLPNFLKDATDRNRTSPFAFTGNKFEFRMPGSAFSIAGANIVLNTIVAEGLRQFADTLEKSENFKHDLALLIKNTFKAHKRIIFNGNNYCDEWLKEAEKRGLSNLKTTVDALPEFISDKSVDLFAKHGVFTKAEIHSRYEILMENYCKIIHIEALTMSGMVKREIVPACVDYQSDLSKLLQLKKDFDSSLEEHFLSRISKLSSCLLKKLEILETALLDCKGEQDIHAQAVFYRDKIFTAMSELRLIVDELETLTASKHWRLPTYAEMLHSVI
jgi:glutamine synthetase